VIDSELVAFCDFLVLVVSKLLVPNVVSCLAVVETSAVEAVSVLVRLPVVGSEVTWSVLSETVRITVELCEPVAVDCDVVFGELMVPVVISCLVADAWVVSFDVASSEVVVPANFGCLVAVEAVVDDSELVDFSDFVVLVPYAPVELCEFVIVGCKVVADIITVVGDAKLLIPVTDGCLVADEI